METRIEMVRGPGTLRMDDGSVWTTETTVKTVDDWREVSPLGRVNFGYVEMGAARLICISPQPERLSLGDRLRRLLRPRRAVAQADLG